MLENNLSFINRVKNLFTSTWVDIKKGFITYWIFSIVIIASTLLVLLLLDPDIENMLEYLNNSFDTGIDPDEDTYWQATIVILKNNWLVCVQILLLSFIPIPFIYTLNLVASTIPIGLVFYLLQKVGGNAFDAFFLGFLPHAIFELSVFILIVCYAEKINKIIRRKITNLFRKSKKPVLSFKESIKETLKIFILIATPLVILAAFVEGYISRFLLTLI